MIDTEITYDEIVVHTCCGPCSTSSLLELKEEGKHPIVLFTNDNIESEEEYDKRALESEKVAEKLSLPFIKAPYNHQMWIDHVKKASLEKKFDLALEKEKGKRCTHCFQYNLQKAEQLSKEYDIKYFTTTLSVSPHKNFAQIKKAVENMEGYKPYDFKKGDGFKKSIDLSKKWELYRQDYCGCEFSKDAKIENELKM